MAKEEKQKIKTLMDDLSALESYISDLFTFSPLPIAFISPLGVILEFNPAFERMTGYPAYEAVGEDVTKLFKEPVEGLIKKVLKEDSVKAKEMTLVKKNGEECPVSIFGKARRGEENDPVGLFLGVFDLSEIKEKAKELEKKVEELEKFRKVAVGRELKMIELKEEVRNLKYGKKIETEDE